MYTKEYFVKSFKDQETEDLLHRYAVGELAEEAKQAICLLLRERGISSIDLKTLAIQARKAEYRKTKGNKSCDYCNSSATYKPVLDSGQRFCSVDCLNNTRLSEISEDIPGREIILHAKELKSSECPKCHIKDNNVEARKYHTIISIVFLSFISDKTHICCISCGRKTNFFAIVYCFFLGWWGIPFGIIVALQT